MDPRTNQCDALKTLHSFSRGVPYQLLYFTDDPEDVINANDIPDSYTLTPPMTIPFEAAVHALDGKFLGTVPLTDGLLQLCDTTETIANAAYIFGTYYSYTVSLSHSDDGERQRW